MFAPVLIFAAGNESRGDDALGPLLLRRLEDKASASGLSDQFEFLEEFQLQIEHAMDMRNRKLVLFIDAGMDTPVPFSFCRAKESDEPVLYSHALAPEALLNVYVQFYQEEPPAAFVLCVCGEHFELGEGLSAPATERLSLACEFAAKLLSEPDAAVWDRWCTESVEPDPGMEGRAISPE